MKRIAESKGNAFADLGIPKPEQELMKAKFTLQIHRIIKTRNLAQGEAGKILGIKLLQEFPFPNLERAE